MDLETLQNNISVDKYQSFEEFSVDLKRVFQNCIDYHIGRGSANNNPIVTRAYLLKHETRLLLKEGKARLSGSTKPNTEEWAKRALRVVNELSQLFGGFVEPVNPESLHLQNYCLLIKHPSSLSVVKRKLEAGLYKEKKKFEKDMSRIWKNVAKYWAEANSEGWPEGQDVKEIAKANRQAGEELEKRFDERWENPVKQISRKDRQRHPSPPRPVTIISRKDRRKTAPSEDRTPPREATRDTPRANPFGYKLLDTHNRSRFDLDNVLASRKDLVEEEVEEADLTRLARSVSLGTMEAKTHGSLPGSLLLGSRSGRLTSPRRQQRRSTPTPTPEAFQVGGLFERTGCDPTSSHFVRVRKQESGGDSQRSVDFQRPFGVAEGGLKIAAASLAQAAKAADAARTIQAAVRASQTTSRFQRLPPGVKATTSVSLPVLPADLAPRGSFRRLCIEGETTLWVRSDTTELCRTSSDSPIVHLLVTIAATRSAGESSERGGTEPEWWRGRVGAALEQGVKTRTFPCSFSTGPARPTPRGLRALHNVVCAMARAASVADKSDLNVQVQPGSGWTWLRAASNAARRRGLDASDLRWNAFGGYYFQVEAASHFSIFHVVFMPTGNPRLRIEKETFGFTLEK